MKTKRLIVFSVYSLILASCPVFGQDRITYYDRSKKADVVATGAIEEETPAKVVYKTTSGRREVAAGDIIDIAYEVPAGVRLDYYNPAVSQERQADKAANDTDRRKLLTSALNNFKEALTRLDQKAKLFARRHVQFKVAQLTARLADDDRSQDDAAIEALESFKKAHPDGWQIVPCARLLARLQMHKEDYEGALKTYEDLAKTPNLTKEVQQEAELLAAQALTRAKRYAEAQKRLQATLKSLPADDPQVDRVQVCLAECQAGTGQFAAAIKQLESIINKTNDNSLKALAYNTLGHCYLENSQPRDAMWAYLWVDVVYNQDKQEHRKALEQLATLFEKRFKDENRAKEYRDRLQKSR